VATVCVTGATGFVASQLVKDLLHKNYKVRGTVRSLAKAESYKHLKVFPGAERLELVEANNEDEDSFKKAFVGCTHVHHTASPFFHASADKAEELLIKPAIAGAVNALKAAVASGVKKVVLTSSMAAVCGSQRQKNPSHLWTEADWNDTTTLSYAYSKLAAEKAAWDFAKEHPELKLITINPCFVMGPVYSSYNSTSTSVGWIVKFFDGSSSDGVKQNNSGIIDVRTVSAMHIAAMEKDGAHGRYLCCNTSQTSDLQAARILAEAFPQYDIPTTLKAGEVDKEPIAFSTDHSKAEKELGVTFNPVKDTLIDMAKSLIEVGIIPRKQ